MGWMVFVVVRGWLVRGSQQQKSVNVSGIFVQYVLVRALIINRRPS
jgi:hypothetical protein